MWSYGHASLAGGGRATGWAVLGREAQEGSGQGQPAEGWESCPQQGGCCHEAGVPHLAPRPTEGS